MSKTDNKNHIRNGIHRLCHQDSKLNQYVQNTKVLNTLRVSAELAQLSIQLNELSIQTKIEGGLISKEK